MVRGIGSMGERAKKSRSKEDLVREFDGEKRVDLSWSSVGKSREEC